jgi:hypothetical protein
MAGLWRNDIICGLLWRNVYNVMDCSLPATYRAPSWSWASIDCGINYGGINVHNCTVCIDVIAISCTLAGEEPTGEVIDGWITVSGLLKMAWVTAHVDGPEKLHHLGVFANRNQLDYIGWLEARLGFDT